MAASYIDRDGYERGELEHSDLIHRQIAYRDVFQPNRHLFPRPFSHYQVHHRDGDKRNNAVSNLVIVTKREHEAIHGVKKRSFIGNLMLLYLALFGLALFLLAFGLLIRIAMGLS